MNFAWMWIPLLLLWCWKQWCKIRMSCKNCHWYIYGTGTQIRIHIRSYIRIRIHYYTNLRLQMRLSQRGEWLNYSRNQKVVILISLVHQTTLNWSYFSSMQNFFNTKTTLSVYFFKVKCIIKFPVNEGSPFGVRRDSSGNWNVVQSTPSLDTMTEKWFEKDGCKKILNQQSLFSCNTMKLCTFHMCKVSPPPNLITINNELNYRNMRRLFFVAHIFGYY